MTAERCKGMIDGLIATMTKDTAAKQKELCSLNPMTGETSDYTPPNAAAPATPTTPPTETPTVTPPVAAAGAVTCKASKVKQTCNMAAAMPGEEGWVACSGSGPLSYEPKRIEDQLKALTAEYDKCTAAGGTAGAVDVSGSFDGNKFKLKGSSKVAGNETLATCLTDAITASLAASKSAKKLNDAVTWIGGDGAFYKLQVTFDCTAP
jgi:hypothetical protein